ncbi:PREDICTED: C-X-C motif chemokine 13 [Propithecus coquereli]|uniref:C-X-C motif chemokine n=1 Tax=Propithecus coquereli TaxID=379532 RepID=A0A2K6ETS5_PROCO|nr:PREDICTED: C-X-C motif chemokine 13 [Propithecus coquereli]
MSVLPASLLLLLLGSSLSPVQGVLEAYYTNLKCKCIQEISDFVHPRLIDQLQVLPRGNGCAKTEIILWMKNKSVICVNPQSKWIQKILKMSHKKKMFSTPPTPVIKRRIS